MKKVLIQSLVAAALSMTLVGCGQSTSTVNEPKTSASLLNPAFDNLPTMLRVKNQAHYMTEGPLMASKEIFVFFDPQCPHCANLYLAFEELNSQVKVNWIPVGALGPISEKAGAEMLASSEPLVELKKHAIIVSSGKRLSPGLSSDSEAITKVKANTELFMKLGINSVPAVLMTDANGKFVQKIGFIPSAEVLRTLGLKY